MSDGVLLADNHPVDPDDELLVAYLDGELDDGERASVEKRLVGEVGFRHRLQALQTGWEWLDDLPDESTNEKLVESTIELVVADILPRKKTDVSWFRQNWKSVAFVSVLLFGFLAGVVGTSLAKRVALKKELEELAIAEDHQAYSLGPKFSFYYALAYNPQWQTMLKTIEQVGRRSMAPPSIIREIPLEERAASIQTLSTDDRERLVGRWETYNGYSDATKEKIRQTAQKVREQDDGELLLRTMKAASVWIEDLSDELRDDLLSDDEAVRNEAIDDAIGMTMADLANESGRLISDETSDRIYLWLQLLYTQRLEAMPELTARIEFMRNSLKEQGRPAEWVDYGFLRSMVDDRAFRNRGGVFGSSRMLGSGGPGPGFPGFIRPPEPRPPEARDGKPPLDVPRADPERRPRSVRIPRITDDEIADLKSVLSDDALEDLVALTSLSTKLAGDVAVTETLRTWAAESVRRNAPVFDTDEMTPLDRYRAREDRDVLDLRPADEIVNEIYSRPGWRSGLRGRPR